MICQECKEEFKTERGLHVHIAKSHKLLLQDYYSKFFPRKDWYSNEDIVFNDTEDYFSRDFNSKENFAKWCNKEDNDKVRKYIGEAFQRRVVKKNSLYIPSHLELKTLFLPSFIGVKKIFGDVKNFIGHIDSIGLQTKYNYLKDPVLSNKIPEILIDTREQAPLNFFNSRIVKLSCGDYTTTGDLYSDVFIERKSLPDLVSTLSSGIERFKKEIDRAKKLGYYLVVVVEDKFSNAMAWSPQTSFSKFVNGKYIFYRIREIGQEFDNIQFVFANSRNEAKETIIKIFQLQEQVKSLDLEYLKDFKYI